MTYQTKASVVPHSGSVLFAQRFISSKHPLYEALRTFLLGLRIKLLLLRGYGVVVVGHTGTGKTYLLEKALPGRVVGPSWDVVLAGKRGAFDLAKMPEGMFAIDEPTYFELSDLLRAYPALRRRRVVFAVQALTNLALLKLDELFENRLVIVYLGTRDEFVKERALT